MILKQGTRLDLCVNQGGLRQVCLNRRRLDLPKEQKKDILSRLKEKMPVYQGLFQVEMTSEEDFKIVKCYIRQEAKP